MLEVVSTVRSPSKADHHRHGGAFDLEDVFTVDDDNLLDYIDFTTSSSCCVDVPFFDADGDILPDLEVDPTELLAEFDDACPRRAHDDEGKKKEESPAAGGQDAASWKKKKNGDEVVLSAVTTEEDSAAAAAGSSDTKSSSAEGHSSKKKKKKKKTSSAAAGDKNNSHGKRKVDWTPELHRRFVQAVEQLGIDKAVPSRILEIMGIGCLTRHNIASHLQKYRSHRKHVMAREAEAATWAHKRHMMTIMGAPRMMMMTKDVVMPSSPWVPPPGLIARPLHVWGHPPPSGGVHHLHLAPPRPSHSYYWHYTTNAARKWGPHAVMTPPTMPPAATMLPRFPMMPHPMYRSAPPQSSSKQIAATLQQLQLDAHPSTESIDAAIGDVLVKPWLPLPLGLKPPSLDSVMSELHKHGIPNIPPS